MPNNAKNNNPYRNSDTNKRYYTFDYYTKKVFGKKCAKLPVDAGFTCPNVDGKKGSDGCIYCDLRGGGAFRTKGGTVTQQLVRASGVLKEKWGNDIGFIPYFQSGTNTYAPPELLDGLYREAAMFPGAVALSIATRADCLPEEVCRVLYEMNRLLPVTVELGLQTANEDTARAIGRRMTLSEFEKGYKDLEKTGVRRCIHIINGLPGEGGEDMLNTAKYVADLAPDEVKIHMLYVTRETALCGLWENKKLLLMEKEQYVSTVCRQLTLLPPDTVIGRLTGDAPLGELVAPLWTAKKISVLNDIDKFMARENIYQGMDYKS